MRTLFVPVLILALCGPAAALPAVNCHCFRDRNFDPERPAAVDPYLLATAQNSLLAAAFNLPKKDVVKMRMSGVPGEALWVAHFVAESTGKPAAELLQARALSSSWPDALIRMQVDPAQLPPKFTAALARRGTEEALAEAAAAEVLISRLKADPGEIEALQEGGASLRETILAAVVARCTGRPAPGMYEAVRSGGRSWGELWQNLGLEPESMETEIGKLLR